jgi:hypothetical protein
VGRFVSAPLRAFEATQTNSGHNIYLYSPALVTNAIREVVEVRAPAPTTTS